MNSRKMKLRNYYRFLWIALVGLNSGINSTFGKNTITLFANVTFVDQDGTRISVCPIRSPVEFVCNGTDVTALTWRRNNATIRSLTIFHSPNVLMPTSFSGVQVQLVSVSLTSNRNRANMISRLVINPSALRSGDEVSCGSSAETEILVYIKKAPPPPALFTSEITKDAASPRFVELTLQWNDSFTETHAVDEYCVTARGGVCQPEAVCLNPDIIYVCGGLETGRLYEFSVYARNCDNETGFNMSTPLLVSPQVPEEPSMCMNVPVYNQSTDKLLAIQSTWNNVPDPMDITNGVHQDVLGYNISYSLLDNTATVTNKTVSVRVPDVCTRGNCKYNHSATFLGSSYTVSVAAENIAGFGEYLTCTPDEISTTNNVLKVTTYTSVPEYVNIDCYPLAVTTMCKICYGHASFSCHNLTCLPGVYPNADGRATVTLTGIEKRVTYCYTATVTVSNLELLVVKGSFTTACNVLDLVYYGLSTIEANADLRCPPDSVGTVRIPNGVVCYSGITLGSTAFYICDDGYKISANSSQRTCQADGHWRDDIPSCLQAPGNGVNSTVTVVIIFSLVLLLIVAGGCVVCLLYKLKHSRKQQTQAQAKSASPASEVFHQRALPPIPAVLPKSDKMLESAVGDYEELDYLTLDKNIAYRQVESTS